MTRHRKQGFARTVREGGVWVQPSIGSRPGVQALVCTPAHVGKGGTTTLRGTVGAAYLQSRPRGQGPADKIRVGEGRRAKGCTLGLPGLGNTAARGPAGC